MKTLQQHIEEKLVINKDLKTITNLSPKPGDKMYIIDFWNNKLTPCIGTLNTIRKHKSITIKNNTYDDVYSFDMNSIRANGKEWYWDVEFILDKDFYCFIYVCYNQYYDVSNIAFAFTEDYKQPFMNVINSILPEKTYSYKAILKCMDIDEDLFVKKYGDKCFEDKSYYFETSDDEFNDFKNKI